MNVDVIGCLNIAKKSKAIIPNPSWRGRDNWVLAHPVLLRCGEAQTSPVRNPRTLVRGRMSNEYGLILETKQGSVLIVGCSHPRVDKLAHRVVEVIGEKPLLVIGGFHAHQEEQ